MKLVSSPAAWIDPRRRWQWMQHLVESVVSEVQVGQRRDVDLVGHGLHVLARLPRGARQLLHFLVVAEILRAPVFLVVLLFAHVFFVSPTPPGTVSSPSDLGTVHSYGTDALPNYNSTLGGPNTVNESLLRVFHSSAPEAPPPHHADIEADNENMRVHGAEEDVEAVSRPHCGDTLPVPTVESNLGLQILEDSATATAALQYLHMILDENQSPCAVQNSAWALADSIHHSALSRVGLDTSSSSLLDAGKLARITMEHLVHVDVAGSHSQRANVALKLITQLPGWNLELVQQLVHKHINLESILQDVSWMHPLEVQMTPMQLFGLEIWKARDANASVGFSHHEYDKYLFCINEVLLLRGFVSVPVGARRRGHERFMYLDVCITSMPKYVDDTELSTLCACRYCDEHQEKSSGFRGLESIASEVVELLKSQFHFTCAHESEKEGRVLGFLRFKDFRIGIDIKFRHLHQLAVTIFHWTGPPEFVSRIIVYAMEFKRARIEGDCVIVDKEIVFPRSERELFETILSMEYPAPHERV